MDKQTPERPANISTKEEREAVRARARLNQKQLKMHEMAALRTIAEQAHATAQRAVAAFLAVVRQEIKIIRVDGAEQSLLIIKSPPGLMVDDNLCNEISGLLKVSVLPIYGDQEVFVDELNDKLLASLGLARTPKPLKVVDDEQDASASGQAPN